MALNPTSPVTGAAVTGLTSPTYTFTEDQAPDGNTRKFIITALGGTQTGVEIHTVSSPFYLLIQRPATMKPLGRVNPNSGIASQFPVNTYRIRFYKGATVQPAVNMEGILVFDCTLRVPAGFDNDAEEAKALLSFVGGFFNANASGLYDLIATNSLK